MAALLYLTSATVKAITVPVATLICFRPDAAFPGTTLVFTTAGPVRVLEDARAIVRLLVDRPHCRAAAE